MKIVIDSLEELLIFVQLIKGKDPNEPTIMDLTKKLEVASNSLNTALENQNG